MSTVRVERVVYRLELSQIPGRCHDPSQIFFCPKDVGKDVWHKKETLFWFSSAKRAHLVEFRDPKDRRKGYSSINRRDD